MSENNQSNNRRRRKRIRQGRGKRGIFKKIAFTIVGVIFAILAFYLVVLITAWM